MFYCLRNNWCWWQWKMLKISNNDFVNIPLQRCRAFCYALRRTEMHLKAVRACGAETLTACVEKAWEMLILQISGLVCYSVPLGYLRISACAIIIISTYAERKASAPVVYGFMEHSNLCCSADKVSSLLSFFSSHSHIVMTFHPSDINFLVFKASRSMFLFILSTQNFVFDFGITKYRHWLWPCQKQPLIKIAVLYFGRTISGVPGNLLSFFL